MFQLKWIWIENMTVRLLSCVFLSEYSNTETSKVQHLWKKSVHRSNYSIQKGSFIRLRFISLFVCNPQPLVNEHLCHWNQEIFMQMQNVNFSNSLQNNAAECTEIEFYPIDIFLNLLLNNANGFVNRRNSMRNSKWMTTINIRLIRNDLITITTNIICALLGYGPRRKTHMMCFFLSLEKC